MLSMFCYMFECRLDFSQVSDERRVKVQNQKLYEYFRWLLLLCCFCCFCAILYMFCRMCSCRLELFIGFG